MAETNITVCLLYQDNTNNTGTHMLGLLMSLITIGMATLQILVHILDSIIQVQVYLQQIVHVAQEEEKVNWLQCIEHMLTIMQDYGSPSLINLSAREV